MNESLLLYKINTGCALPYDTYMQSFIESMDVYAQILQLLCAIPWAKSSEQVSMNQVQFFACPQGIYNGRKVINFNKYLADKSNLQDSEYFHHVARIVLGSVKERSINLQLLGSGKPSWGRGEIWCHFWALGRIWICRLKEKGILGEGNCLKQRYRGRKVQAAVLQENIDQQEVRVNNTPMTGNIDVQ